ncbi:MAG: sensor histidine kinase [Nostocales cyanobacterium]|nr:MAG: sensor histidine kinase [Nostocales cyanobacterium]TAF14474.1 MAG: sensor histidine kinase [Nostocales cyanobacterium]
MTYQIVEKHQGNIYVYSHPGHGTEFIIELPIQQVDYLLVISVRREQGIGNREELTN